MGTSPAAPSPCHARASARTPRMHRSKSRRLRSTQLLASTSWRYMFHASSLNVSPVSGCAREGRWETGEVSGRANDDTGRQGRAASGSGVVGVASHADLDLSELQLRLVHPQERDQHRVPGLKAPRGHRGQHRGPPRARGHPRAHRNRRGPGARGRIARVGMSAMHRVSFTYVTYVAPSIDSIVPRARRPHTCDRRQVRPNVRLRASCLKLTGSSNT